MACFSCHVLPPTVDFPADTAGKSCYLSNWHALCPLPQLEDDYARWWLRSRAENEDDRAHDGRAGQKSRSHLVRERGWAERARSRNKLSEKFVSER